MREMHVDVVEASPAGAVSADARAVQVGDEHYATGNFVRSKEYLSTYLSLHS